MDTSLIGYETELTSGKVDIGSSFNAIGDPKCSSFTLYLANSRFGRARADPRDCLFPYVFFFCPRVTAGSKE
jgi:hypothetical protein